MGADLRCPHYHEQRSPKGTKMAETSDSIDLFAAPNFILNVDGMRAGFAEVEGLANETDIIDYREGNEDSTVGKLLRIRKLTNVILR